MRSTNCRGQTSRLSRRQWLARAAATSTLMAAAQFIPRRAFGASERIQLGFIGCKNRGMQNLEGFGIIGRQAGQWPVDAAALCDVDAKVLAATARTVEKVARAPSTFGDWRRMLERKDLDAVVISVPDHWHALMTIEACRAGKDVYCEKPLTLTIDEGKVIGDAVKKYQRVFQVGTQQRSEFDRRFLKAVALCRSGRLGKKLKARVQTGGAPSGGPFQETEPPKELDWEMYCGQAPKVPFCKERIGWNFRWWLEYSGGQVTDWGVHHMDIALWALGGDETGPATIEGKGDFPRGVWKNVHPVQFLNGQVPLGPSYNVTPSYECEIKLPNGNEITFTSNGGNDLILAGENGTIHVNRDRIEGAPLADVEKSETDRKWLDAEVEKLYRGMPIQGHMANFFHCVKNRLKPISDVWTHVNSVNVCHMANIAMLLKKPLRWDAKRYMFADPEAQALVKRTQRKGYETKV